MKKLKYIILSLTAVACLCGCKKDPELAVTDVGPEMSVVSVDSKALFGAAISFQVTMNDKLPLSTLKAQLFFDDEMVAEEVIRTKTSGTYDGTLTVPYYKDIPDGDATLRFVGQNIEFGLTTIEQTIPVSRPEPDYLTFVLDEQEYRMEPTGTKYEYSVTDNFPQKAKGYITTPELDELGSVVTFGYSSTEGGIVADSTDPITFSNSNAGEYTITFNILTFAGSPFTKLTFNGTEMNMSDEDNYYIVTTLTQGNVYEMSGIADFASWDIDRDFFERPDASAPESIKFLPMSGMYKITANFKFNYLKVEAMNSSSELGTLSADGSGTAIWVIGDTNIGKPSTANSASWNPENGGLCMARVADKKYQITLVAGTSINASKFDFKFFWKKTWDNGEFLGKDDPTFKNPYGVLTTDSDIIELSDSGNAGLIDGKTLDPGGVYRFTLDVSGGTKAATLTLEKIGEEALPAADLTINGSKLEQIDSSNYSIDLDLTQGQTLTFGGSDMFMPSWINPDFFAITSATTATLVPVSGKYRITVNTATGVIDALVLNADGTGLATLDDQGHGAVYFIGYGFGSPATANEPAWTTEKGICVPEAEPGIYRVTAQAGPEGSTTPGQRFRINGWSGKFYKSRGWSDLGTLTLSEGSEAFFQITSGGNIEMAEGVSLEEGATYILTLDVTGGNDKPVLTMAKQ